MPNALDDYVVPRDLSRNFGREITQGHEALDTLVTVRQNVLNMLAEVQANPNIPVEVQAAAQARAAGLRQAILDLAGTL